MDLRQKKLVRKLPAGSDPEEFAVSKDGTRLYVSNEDVGTASVVGVADGRVLGIVRVKKEPEGVAITPDGRFVYVTCETGGEVCVIDTATNKAVAEVAVDGRPRTVAFLPDGSRAFVPSETAGTVTVVDGTYDDAVRASAALAGDRVLVISDTSWEGYREVPGWVIEGYGTIFSEIDEQLAGGASPDLVVAQMGVGALAAAVVDRWAHRAEIVVVEPLGAACGLRSAAAGHPVEVPGPHRSIMAGLPFVSGDSETASVALWRLYKSGQIDAEYADIVPLFLTVFPQSGLHFTHPVTAASAPNTLLTTPKPAGKVPVTSGRQPTGRTTVTTDPRSVTSHPVLIITAKRMLAAAAVAVVALVAMFVLRIGSRTSRRRLEVVMRVGWSLVAFGVAFLALTSR